MPKPEPVRITINVRGGVVQSVHCDAPRATYFVADYDDLEVDGASLRYFEPVADDKASEEAQHFNKKVHEAQYESHERRTGEKHPDPTNPHICDDCGIKWAKHHLAKARDLAQRVDAGGPVPSGECPACGALCYPEATEGKAK